MNLGNLLNKGIQSYTNLVDKALNVPGAMTGIGVASGVPGMDKILLGIEKLIPDGGIKLGGNNSKATTKNQLADPTLNSKALSNSKIVPTEPTPPVFDWKSWSTYPQWAKYCIYGALPFGLVLWALFGMKTKGKSARRF
jgi:hypothetical protein